jgi:uncharacterized protein with GYD domain
MAPLGGAICSKGVKAMPESYAGRLLEDTRFLFLIRFTSEGIRTLKAASGRIAKLNAFATRIGTRCGFVATSGKYDVLTLFDGNDAQAYQFHIYLRSQVQFEVVDMVKIEAASPEAYMALIQPLTVAD